MRQEVSDGAPDDRTHRSRQHWLACNSEPIPVKSLDKRRRQVPIQFGVHRGKTAIQALCPMCQKEGCTFWIRVGIVEGGE